jgi:nitrite reductase/ring-hydroxylating ferredoxin subunit
MSDWVWAAKLRDVTEEKANIVEVDGRTLALYRIGDSVHATNGHCPHEGECLESGFVENGTVECALHYAVFEIATGQLISGPTTGPLPVYPARIDGEDVYVRLTP